MIICDLRPHGGFTARIDKSVVHSGRQATLPTDLQRFCDVLLPLVKRSAQFGVSETAINYVTTTVPQPLVFFTSLFFNYTLCPLCCNI